MMERDAASAYALGYTTEEHERLMRQSTLLAPVTERLFRAAGIRPGDRVLDVGSGVGDVSLLLGRIVGPTGSVVGIERDAGSIARARLRAAAEGLENLSFVQSDVANPDLSGDFDAVAGRFILMYMPDPAAVLRSLTTRLRRGGAVAFLEPSWAAARGPSTHLALYSACAAAIVEMFKACGVDPEMGTAAHRAFLDAGLPAPTMSIELMFGSGPEFTRALVDILRSLAPQAQSVSLASLGDLDTLDQRLRTELRQSGSAISWLAGHVGVWCRTG